MACRSTLIESWLSTIWETLLMAATLRTHATTVLV